MRQWPAAMDVVSTPDSALRVDGLPSPLADQLRKDFDCLFDLRPDRRGDVHVFGGTRTTNRWHQSFMDTPACSGAFENSTYMYGVVKDRLPEMLLPLLEHMNADQRDPYNQATVSWYVDGKDHMPMHKDSRVQLLPGSPIAIVVLGDANRIFRVRNCRGLDYYKLDQPCPHGTVLTMTGDFQREFRHGVPKDKACSQRRISVSFRKAQQDGRLCRSGSPAV